IVQLYFREGFLQSDMRVEAVGSAEHVWSDNAEFADVEVVDADFWCDADAPVHWFKGSVSAKQIEGEAQRLVHEFLLAAAEEFVAAGFCRADIAGRRHAPRVEGCVRCRRDVQENLLA